MAHAALVAPDVDGGQRLIKKLVRQDFPVLAAFWILVPEAEDWRLVISSPVVDEQGPLAAYKRIQRVLQELPDVRLRIYDIAAVGRRDQRVARLRSVLKQSLDSDITRFTNNVIDGSLVEDAYIYLL